MDSSTRRRALSLIGSASLVSLSGCTTVGEILEDGESEETPEQSQPNWRTEQSDEAQETSAETRTPRNTPNPDYPTMPPIYVWGIEGHTAPDIDGAETYESEFSYQLGGETHRLSSEIPRGLVDYYESRPRNNRDWGRYVSDPHDKLAMMSTAGIFRQKGDTPWEQVNHAMRFVQSLEYTRDEISAGRSQYTAYPIETMETTEGDCEDTTLLLASLLDALNIGSVIFDIPEEQHMALGVLGEESISGSSIEYRDESYYYAETTALGWEFGEAPEDMIGANVEIYELHDTPILNTGWNARRAIDDDQPNHVFGLEVLVANNGRAPAQDVAVDVAVETSGGRVFDQAQVDIGRVGPRGTERGYTTLDAYDGEMRLSFRTGERGLLRDDATTEWVSPER